MSKLVLLLDHDGTLVINDQLRALETDLVDSALNQHIPPPENLQLETNLSLMEANKALLLKLTSDFDQHEKGPFEQCIVGSGSKRQNWFCDTSNSIRSKKYSSSSFMLLTYIKEHLKNQFPSVILDMFLTSDHFAEQEDGTLFETMLNWLNGEHYPKEHFLFKDYPIDNSKISMIFAWVQRISSQGGGVVRFVDDELQKDQNGMVFIHPVNPVVLSAVIPFFQKYPRLIPNNVTLEIIHCTNREPKREASILGTGIAYTNYLPMMEQMMLESITAREDRYQFTTGRSGSCSCFELFNKPEIIDQLLAMGIPLAMTNDDAANQRQPILIDVNVSSGIDMHILGGFLAVCGVVAIAVAFAALNAATLGLSGLIVAGIGTASLLIGAGLFSAGTATHCEAHIERESLNVHP